jgi:hypothetical protein
LYLGDWDFSGGHIEANTKSVLEREVGRLAWKRLAVTDRQIERYTLTVIQKYDARTKSYHDAVESRASGESIPETFLSGDGLVVVLGGIVNEHRVSHFRRSFRNFTRHSRQHDAREFQRNTDRQTTRGLLRSSQRQMK